MATIVNRIQRYIKYKGISMRSFESHAGLTNGIISSALKRKNDLSWDSVSKIVDTYTEIDIEWLITGHGQMLKVNDEVTPIAEVAEIPQRQETREDITLPRTDEFEYVNNDNGGSVPLLHELSFATLDLDDPKSVQADEHYYIKEFRNADFMMRVAGDNMYPKYKPGDLIACRHHCYTNFYQWGKVYALLTCHQGILIGRVFEHHQNKIFVTLKSENPSYPEWEIPIDEIARAAVVIGSISLD